VPDDASAGSRFALYILGAFAFVAVVLAGIAFGAWALRGSIQSLLFGVRPTDPVTFGAVGAILHRSPAALPRYRRFAPRASIRCLRSGPSSRYNHVLSYLGAR
jgi:hypothetical protein